MDRELTLDSTYSDLDTQCINTIRFLSVDAVQNANSGHPGLPLGAAPMAYVLWSRFLKHNPMHPEWFDRDRFVLSAGHGSMLLYSLLFLTGYDLTLDDLKRFRQWNSKTPGHPERGVVPGVETTTGPLGQGFGNGVGMAIAEKHLAAIYNKPGHEIINHYTYGIVSDGDLMEGVASEAASLAGHLCLNKLIYLYDDNRITLSASTNLTMTEDCGGRFEAYHWNVLRVEDGNDPAAIDQALRAARTETLRPSLIIVHTHIGYGSPHKQDTFEAHGSPLGNDEVELTKRHLGWPTDRPFFVPEPALEQFRRARDRGEEQETIWKSRFASYAQEFPSDSAELLHIINSELPGGWDSAIPVFPPDKKGIATRVASGKILNAIAPKLPSLIGGSADLDPSTHTALHSMGDFESPSRQGGDTQGSVGGGWGFGGRNIHYGVREHAMGAISNGLAAHGGCIPYCSTFLIFSDYMRPAIRLAALMRLRVIYVFTHDSIGVGEDGPTHEPVEQLASLRAIPHLVVIRPSDANETSEAWRAALTAPGGPVALILTRQNIPVIDRTEFSSAEGLKRGAYILAESRSAVPDLILIGSGSEVALILEARTRLAESGLNARVVSMPSWELFDSQPAEYRRAVLAPGIPRLAVEAGVRQGWRAYVGDDGDVIGIDDFGASAPGPVVMEKYGFTVDNVLSHATRLVKKNGRNAKRRTKPPLHEKNDSP